MSLVSQKLWNLIKRGIIRIFPLPRFVLYLFVAAVTCTLIGCATPSKVTQLVRDVRTDTIYINSQQYDSIYIYKDRYQDRSKDTIYLRNVSIEYRYKLLRDTVKVIQRDSIPYEVTIVETKELTRPLTWYDHLTRLTFWFVIGSLITFIFLKLRRK